MESTKNLGVGLDTSIKNNIGRSRIMENCLGTGLWMRLYKSYIPSNSRGKLAGRIAIQGHR